MERELHGAAREDFAGAGAADPERQRQEGRSSPEWVDFNFHGHQIVAHLAPQEAGEARRNAVDGHGVPVRHFGVVLPMAQWRRSRRG